MEFCVVFLDAVTFVDGAASGANAKAEVPHGAREFGDERAKFGFNFFVGEEEEDVEVRIGEEHAAAVAPESEEAEAFGFGAVSFEGFFEDLLQAAVGEVAEGGQCFAGTGAMLEFLADTRSLVLALRSEVGNGNGRT